MWLAEKPDTLKVTTEAHDKAEMPESGIALAELAAAAQDLLGDLLKEDKKAAKEADDSATNHAMPDVPAGGEVGEGDIASFAAQGKSGNQTPDHKEQDGRSNVGRQGMAVGETAAGSGTIGEGDIGTHFPPSDPQWKGAASRIFLEKAVLLLEAKRKLKVRL
jgi:hypothetical protein